MEGQATETGADTATTAIEQLLLAWDSKGLSSCKGDAKTSTGSFIQRTDYWLTCFGFSTGPYSL